MARTSVQYRDVTSAQQRDATVSDLLADGFVIQRETGEQTYLVQPKQFGAAQWMSVLFGLICFIIPAVVYLAMWSAKPIPVVVVRLKALQSGQR